MYKASINLINKLARKMKQERNSFLLEPSFFATKHFNLDAWKYTALKEGKYF